MALSAEHPDPDVLPAALDQELDDFVAASFDVAIEVL